MLRLLFSEDRLVLIFDEIDQVQKHKNLIQQWIEQLKNKVPFIIISCRFMNFIQFNYNKAISYKIYRMEIQDFQR